MRSTRHAAARSRWRIGLASALAAGTMVAPLVVAGAAPAGASTVKPTIALVKFLAQGDGKFCVIVRGNRLGFLPTTDQLPYTGDIKYFRIGDGAGGEWGYKGDTSTLLYKVWTSKEVYACGFGGLPGTSVVVALWNPTSGNGATWGGNVPPPPKGTPKITGISFSGSGKSLHVTVTGTGFGGAPHTMPYTGDLNDFAFWDGRSHCTGSAQFTAGGAYFGTRAADAVTLVYTSWTSTKIVVSGFSGSYGSKCAVAMSDDPVAVTVYDSADVGATGLQTARSASI
jgi:hypothetical protein